MKFLNVRPETVKLLKESLELTFKDIGMGKQGLFFVQNHKALQTKTKIDK